MADDNRTLIGSSVPPFRLVFFMWLVFTMEAYFYIDLGYLGILPRTVFGLVGVLFAPLLHGNVMHLISNTIPLLFLGGVLFFYYHRVASAV
ncbi:MAG: hypothetical protein R3345_10370, partial [Fulvivirga sp.]|nr:hypothetical protein [Fulvivirga sp.]